MERSARQKSNVNYKMLALLMVMSGNLVTGNSISPRENNYKQGMNVRQVVSEKRNKHYKENIKVCKRRNLFH